MERDFRYLREMYGDAGARELFEKICAQLLHAQYGDDAHSIRVSQGDEGVDIFVGNFSTPIVYQCKFFLDGIGTSQKKQIRDSFGRAISAMTYKMKKWVLCIPCILSVLESNWWDEWRSKQIEQTGVEIGLYDGGYLISELKRHNLYSKIFDDDVRLKLDAILTILQNDSTEKCQKTESARIDGQRQEGRSMSSRNKIEEGKTKEIASPDEFGSVLEYLFMSMESSEQIMKLCSLLSDMRVQGAIHAVADEEILYFNSIIVDEEKRVIYYFKNEKKVFTVFVDSITDLITKISCGVHELTIWIHEGEEVRIAFSF